MSELGPTKRLKAAALVDRLIYGSDTTFWREDATDLLALLPAQSWAQRLTWRLPALRVKGQLPGMGTSGIAAGVGSVQLKDGAADLDYDTHGRLTVRAGQWRLYRWDSMFVPGRTDITIEQVMTDGDADRTALMRYERGEPEAMLLFQEAGLTIGPLTLKVVRSVPWKVPASDPRPEVDPYEAGSPSPPDRRLEGFSLAMLHASQEEKSS